MNNNKNAGYLVIVKKVMKYLESEKESDRN